LPHKKRLANEAMRKVSWQNKTYPRRLIEAGSLTEKYFGLGERGNVYQLSSAFFKSKENN